MTEAQRVANFVEWAIIRGLASGARAVLADPLRTADLSVSAVLIPVTLGTKERLAVVMCIANCAFLAVLVGLTGRAAKKLTQAIGATGLSVVAVGIGFAATLQARDPNIADACITGLD